MQKIPLYQTKKVGFCLSWDFFYLFSIILKFSMLLPFSPHFRAQELNYRAQKAQKCERTFCSALCCSCLLRDIIPRLHFLVSNFHFQMKQDVICGALFFLFAKLVADKRPQQEKKAQRELQPTSSLILVMHARRAISPRNNITWPCSHCSKRIFSGVLLNLSP